MVTPTILGSMLPGVVPLTLMQTDVLNMWKLHVIVAMQATDQAAPHRSCVESQLTWNPCTYPDHFLPTAEQKRSLVYR